MSIILDSLKRAERERRVGDAPAVDTIYEEEQRSLDTRKRQKRRWVGLITVNLVVVAVLAAVFYQQQMPPEGVTPPSEPAAKTVVENDSRVETVAPAENAAPALPSSEEQPSPPPALEAGPASAAQDDESAPTEAVRFGPPVAAKADDFQTTVAAERPAAPVDPAAASEPQTTLHAVRQSAGLVSADPAPPAAETEPELETEVITSPEDAPETFPAETRDDTGWTSAMPGKPTKPTPAPPVPQAPVETAPSPKPANIGTRVPQVTPDPEDESPPALVKIEPAPLLKDKPPEVREKLKHVKISVLVYTGRQETSMVYIDSRRYRTGDRVEKEGYLIERIMPDGIILDYGEGRVKIRSGY